MHLDALVPNHSEELKMETERMTKEDGRVSGIQKKIHIV